ncbi:hypothetical protein [Thioalkalivibrio sulfidiphilus]|uniref:hypothetical protein n=1 Tax=Thioalkalivibrio sulfidiphilus TaxID=1033854 RepID=UPI0003615F0C|nr:hypothetical protein [Thioalkalivibrio sulfidiphilus]
MSKTSEQSEMHDAELQPELLDTPGGDSVRLRFEGPFEGRWVRWDACFLALGRGAAGGNYIEAGEDAPDGIRLRVGLAVDCIDMPSLRNAIIMIRQYKRLRRGRHEW